MALRSSHTLLFTTLMATTSALATVAQAQSSRTLGQRGFDQQFQRAEKDTSRFDDGEIAAAGIAVAPGARVYTGAAVMGGSDSNLDQRSSNAKRSSFGEAELGSAIVVTREESQTTALARGSFARYGDYDFRPDRWNAGALVDHLVKMSDAWKLHIGGFYEADRIDIDRPAYAGGYLQLQRTLPGTSTFVRVRSMHTGYGNDVGSVIGTGLLSEVDKSYSNLRTEASTGTIFRKNEGVAPYLEVAAATIDFTQQINTAVLNRDSREVYGIAGLRITASPQLRFDLGGRINDRRLDDPNMRNHTSGFFDGKIVWTPRDDLSVEFNVGRTYTDPIATAALFTDRTAADVNINAKITEKIKAEVDVGVEKLDQIGASKHYDGRFANGRIGYQIAPRTEVFSVVKVETIKDSTTGETSNRNVYGAGVKVGF